MTSSRTVRRPISGEEEHFLLEFAHFLSGGRSPASIAAYQSDIRLFAEHTSGIDLLRITTAQENDYIARLESRGLKRATITRKGTALRHFRQFLFRIAPTVESLNPILESNTQVECRISIRPSAFIEQNEIDETLSTFMCNVMEHRSQATVRAYTSDLLKFRECLRSTTKWHQVSKQLIADFIDQQTGSGLNSNSAARLLSVIRSLFTWLQKNHYVIGNPTIRLRVPRGGKKVPVPSVSDLEAITSAEIPSEFSALRDLLTFELLYRCGLRVSEISRLNIASVDLNRKRLTIQGRQDRRRYINLPESVSKVLASYLGDRKRIGGSDSAPLVVNLRGGRLTVRSIGRVVERLAASNKWPEGTHPHSLRHAYASHGLKSGKDVLDIRHSLGISGVSAVLKAHN